MGGLAGPDKHTNEKFLFSTSARAFSSPPEIPLYFASSILLWTFGSLADPVLAPISLSPKIE